MTPVACVLSITPKLRLINTCMDCHLPW